MKKFIIFGIVITAIAAACIWYIFNGGANTEENIADNTPTTSQTAEEQAATSQDTIATVIDNQKNEDDFYELLTKAALIEFLSGSEAYTVFAPTDAALEATDEAVLAALDKPENAEQRKKVAQYHIVKGTLTLDDLKGLTKVPTVAGQELLVVVEDNQVYVIDAKGQKARLGTSNITASNGVVHEINALLLPQ